MDKAKDDSGIIVFLIQLKKLYRALSNLDTSAGRKLSTTIKGEFSIQLGSLLPFPEDLRFIPQTRGDQP